MIKDFDVIGSYLKMAEWPKYKSYMQDIRSKIPSPYCFENAEPVRVILESLGFQITELSIHEREFDFESRGAYYNFLKSITHFISEMSDDLKHDYLNDLVKQQFGDETGDKIDYIMEYKFIYLIAKLS